MNSLTSLLQRSIKKTVDDMMQQKRYIRSNVTFIDRLIRTFPLYYFDIVVMLYEEKRVHADVGKRFCPGMNIIITLYMRD